MISFVHLLPGRLRLKVDALKRQPKLATRLHAHLSAVSGIDRVDVNPRTGSVLLHYNPSALASPAFLDAFSEALGQLFPAHCAPGRLRLTVRQLKGRPNLARRIVEHLSPLWGVHRIEIDPSTGDCLLVYDSRAVTRLEFFEALSQPLGSALPQLNVKKMMARVGIPRSAP